MEFLEGRLKPALPSLDVGSDKIFVGLGEIDNSFDDSDDVCHSAGKQTEH